MNVFKFLEQNIIEQNISKKECRYLNFKIYLSLFFLMIIFLFLNYLIISFCLFLFLYFYSCLLQNELWDKKKYFLVTTKLQIDRLFFSVYIIIFAINNTIDTKFIFLTLLFISMFEFIIWYGIADYWLSLSTLLKNSDDKKLFINSMQNSDWRFLSLTFFKYYYEVFILFVLTITYYLKIIDKGLIFISIIYIIIFYLRIKFAIELDKEHYE
jgi:hypothetical protein